MAWEDPVNLTAPPFESEERADAWWDGQGIDRADYAPCRCHTEEAQAEQAREPSWICGGCEEYEAAMAEREARR